MYLNTYNLFDMSKNVLFIFMLFNFQLQNKRVVKFCTYSHGLNSLVFILYSRYHQLLPYLLCTSCTFIQVY